MLYGIESDKAGAGGFVDDAKIFQGDALQVLRTLASGSVHCVVTSPPYFGLRDYGTAVWVGGDAACDHRQAVIRIRRNLAQATNTCDGGNRKAENRTDHNALGIPYSDTCGKCGAVRQDHQLGLERTPDEYVARLVEVFREVRRVMRPDATLWLNLGDSYARNGGDPGGGNKLLHMEGKQKRMGKIPDGNGLKPKDLVGIPWRVAFALQADGWWLRSEIIWAKRAPMPESVTDRPTRSHEQVFLLSKSARYFYDAEAVKEAQADGTAARLLRGVSDHHKNIDGAPGQTPHSMNRPRQHQGKPPRSATFKRDTKEILAPYQMSVQHREEREDTWPTGYRNMRDVWTLGPEPYPEAHFAVFPSEIPRRAILAGTSARGCCPGCGAPWKRVVTNGLTVHDGKTASQYEEGTTANRLAKLRQAARERGEEYSNNKKTIGWRPTCDCPPADPIPCTVLDPFLGSGTTLAVAVELGQRGVGIELNERYIEMANDRIGKVQRPLMTF